MVISGFWTPRKNKCSSDPPTYGALVCGVQCKNEQEIVALYEQWSIDIEREVMDIYKRWETNPSDVLSNAEWTEFQDELPKPDFESIQLNILERTTSHYRRELEQMIETGTFEEMCFQIIGLTEDYKYPQDYIFGVELGWARESCPSKISPEHLGIAKEEIRKRIPQAEIYLVKRE